MRVLLITFYSSTVAWLLRHSSKPSSRKRKANTRTTVRSHDQGPTIQKRISPSGGPPMSITKSLIIYSRRVRWHLLSCHFEFCSCFVIDRIKLLIHMLCNVRDDRITIDKLREAVLETKSSLKHPSHIEIINEILDVRQEQENYQKGKGGKSQREYWVLFKTNKRCHRQKSSCLCQVRRN